METSSSVRDSENRDDSMFWVHKLRGPAVAQAGLPICSSTFIIALTALAVWAEPPERSGVAFVITPGDRAYWAFQPSRQPTLPEVSDRVWPKSPLDRFILARLEERRISSARPATRRELIRRVTFDLSGLPPTPEDVDAFVKDPSPLAFARVVDRLLNSPHYGERWGRHWLDVARYAEDDLYAGAEYRNAWRYRDWVTGALNEDMPYDLFVKAQIAGDLLASGDEDGNGLVAGTGFLALGVWYYGAVAPPQARADERFDRIDAITSGFLGLTVGCARCHDHKYDPISLRDYYALDGIIGSTVYREYPLAPREVVENYREHAKKVEELESALKELVDGESIRLSEILARKTSRYLTAACHLLEDPTRSASLLAQEEGLDHEVLRNWMDYVGAAKREHPYLSTLDHLRARGAGRRELQQAADEFQSLVLDVLAEKRSVDAKNEALVEAAKPDVDPETAVYLPNGYRAGDYCGGCDVVLTPIERTRYILWLDILGTTDLTCSFKKKDYGLFRLRGETLERFLSDEKRSSVATLRAELKALEKRRPPDYPFLHGMADSPRPQDARIHLRGSPYQLGEKTPRRFLTVLSPGEPARFTRGSGRLELAEAIAAHPLTARVVVNRIWQHLFGQGIVRTPSNFGRSGDAPTHLELLEYLTHRFILNGYSIKALHREILLSATYQLSSRDSNRSASNRSAANHTDPDNRLLWRANRRRLDAEALRDSLLFVSGRLDLTVGGASVDLSKDDRRRSLYGQVRRSRSDALLALFDFPDASLTSEKRSVTNVPLQRLFFLNGDLVWRQAGGLVRRLGGAGKPVGRETIQKAYRLLFCRDASPGEIEAGLEFLREARGSASSDTPALQQYLQVLLSSNEFLYVD